MPGPTQADQPAQLSVLPGLHADDLLLEGFVASEQLSRPFEIVVEAFSVDNEIDLQAHLGQGLGIKVKTGVDKVDRLFHGVLYEAQTLGMVEHGWRYRLTLRPWLSLLALGSNSRIFQKMSVQDIIKKVFADAGFSAYAMNLANAGSKVREYCVQFRESDFHFISRLMEDEGIYYYFAHSEHGHSMQMCEGHDNHPPFAHGTLAVDWQKGPGPDSPVLSSWERRLKPSIIKATLRDAHFQKTTSVLSADKEAPSANPAERAEAYDYPGGFGYFVDDGSESGAPYAQTLLLQGRVDRETYHAQGTTFAVPVGQRVKVKTGQSEVEVMVTSATHRLGPQNYMGSGGVGETTVDLHIAFEAVPYLVDWKAPSITPKPTVSGPQVAVVVGQSGEVIDVDKYGRVKVQFPWDRQGKNNQDSSCWVRVSQGWADGGFGQIVLPRIGEEVLVEFLDGDLDRPVITGRVYNSALMPPYPLPADKTKSTWKSQTVGKSGSYDEAEEAPSGTGFNELRFEDKGGDEEVFLHAQRLFNAWIRLDETRKTGRDTKVRVGRNRDVAIKKNETVTIETGDETRSIKQGSRKTEIEKADSLTLKTGDYSLKVSKGQATIEAMQKITLKVGDNTITISQSGIEMKGMTIKATADTALSAQGLTTELKASTANTISGAVVMIN